VATLRLFRCLTDLDSGGLQTSITNFALSEFQCHSYYVHCWSSHLCSSHQTLTEVLQITLLQVQLTPFYWIKVSPTTRQPLFPLWIYIHSKPEGSNTRSLLCKKNPLFALTTWTVRVYLFCFRWYLVTPWSPASPAGMQALLEHSVQSLRPLQYLLTSILVVIGLSSRSSQSRVLKKTNKLSQRQFCRKS
jgi:hypothetical protein